MVIVKLQSTLHMNQSPAGYSDGKELRFPEATGWTVEDVGNTAVLCITKPLPSSCSCEDSSPELLASLPWHTVALVHVPDAIQASV